MPAAPSDASPVVAEVLPEGVRGLLRTLAEAGWPSFLVGGCVRDLLAARTPTDFDVATPAPAERVLEIFPRAVPIGLGHGTVMVPTGAGPIDVTSFRAGPRLVDDLAHRDFTINALALDPESGELVDPFGGRADLAAGRLRAVRDPEERLAEDPLRALRAARLVATLGLRLDPALEAALPGVRRALRGVARERVRAELEALMRGPEAGRALALLRHSGIEAALAPGVAADAAAVVTALPPQVELRLAGWLRGTRVGPLMRGLRFPRRRVRGVERLLRFHPIDGDLDPGNLAAVRRRAHRLGEADSAALLALRRAELGVAGDAEGLERLARFERALAEVRRTGALALGRRELALRGEDVMRVLGAGAGPRVGRALRYLTERVLEDPASNTASRLEELLRSWRDPESG